jgi:hypothetical protein
MGADLICYIAFGPRKIDLGDGKAMKIARQVREYLDDCIAAAEKSILGRKDVPDPRKSPIQAKRSMTLRLELQKKPGLPKFNSIEQLRSHPDYRNLIKGVLADCDHEVEAEYVFDDTLEGLAKEVRDFAANWNKSGFRDMSSRDDPGDRGRKVVVAGELSWGDEPSGGGYQMLKKAFGLGITQLLGVS